MLPDCKVGIVLRSNKYGDKITTVDPPDVAIVGQDTWSQLQCGKLVYARSSSGVLMHRMIMQPADTELIDHKNGDGLCNTRQNMRKCDNAQNGQNQRSRKTPMSTSQFKGVGWWPRSKRWKATITVNQRKVGLGYFQTPEEAAKAYDQAAVLLHGAFATVNFPENIPSLLHKLPLSGTVEERIAILDMQRMSRLRRTNTSGVAGVSFDKESGKWSAHYNGRRLGRFKDFDEAVKVRVAEQATA